MSKSNSKKNLTSINAGFNAYSNTKFKQSGFGKSNKIYLHELTRYNLAQSSSKKSLESLDNTENSQARQTMVVNIPIPNANPSVYLNTQNTFEQNQEVLRTNTEDVVNTEVINGGDTTGNEQVENQMDSENPLDGGNLKRRKSKENQNSVVATSEYDSIPLNPIQYRSEFFKEVS